MANSKPRRHTITGKSSQGRPSSPARPRLEPDWASSDSPLQPRIFISYRRSDSEAAANHLYESLAGLFGNDRVFQDRSTIQPGNPFPPTIEQAIQGATIFIALIGPGWLDAKDKHGHQRLQHAHDYVRLEIESALKHKIMIIPVLVDGARMPGKESLPPSLRAFSESQAMELPWHDGIQKIARRFYAEEEQRVRREAAAQAERAKLDLGDTATRPSSRSQTARASFDVVTNVMERSLAHQGRKISLDYDDIEKSLQKLTGQTLEMGFAYQDLIYVIDHIGVKARGSGRRYVARSFPVDAMDKVPAHIAQRRPVLASVKVFGSWWEKSVAKKGIVDVDKKSPAVQGAIVCAIVGFDPTQQIPKLLTPWPTFGKNGVVWLTRAAAEQCIEASLMRSIEATLKMAPYTRKPSAGEADSVNRDS